VATVYTVGHGARSAEELVLILRQAGVKTLVDVRAYPVSRRHPHFSREKLKASLVEAGIAYDWQGEALGGFRKGGEHSAHTALRHPMFRAYAEHMEKQSFQKAAAALAATAERVCIMCAEGDPAHCHRSLIADWLVVHGHHVVHLLGGNESRAHVLNPAARNEGGRLIYAGPQSRLL
jgi:uncharacterized protein (DUF488 family)